MREQKLYNGWHWSLTVLVNNRPKRGDTSKMSYKSYIIFNNFKKLNYMYQDISACETSLILFFGNIIHSLFYFIFSEILWIANNLNCIIIITMEIIFYKSISSIFYLIFNFYHENDKKIQFLVREDIWGHNYVFKKI